MEIAQAVTILSVAKQGFDQAIDSAENRLLSYSSNSSSAVSKASAAMTAAFTAVASAAIGAALKLDDAYDQIRISTGATGATLESLHKSFESVFSSVPVSAQQAAQAIGLLHARTGETGPALEQLSAKVLELSRLTGTDLASTLNQTTRLFGDWSLQGEAASASLDTLFRATQQTGTGVDRLAELMVKFGAPMRTLGFSFEEAAALLGKFEKEGVNTELTMSSLRIALGKMAKAGIQEPAEAFKVLTERIASAKTEGEATTLAFEVFGRRAGVDMAKAIREGRFSIEELFNSIRNGQDTIQSASKDTYGFSESMVLLKNQVMLALQPLGISLLNAFENLKPAIQTTVGLITDLLKWFSGLPQPVQVATFGIIALNTALRTLAGISLAGLVSQVYGLATAASSALGPWLKLAALIGGVMALASQAKNAASPFSTPAARPGAPMPLDDARRQNQEMLDRNRRRNTYGFDPGPFNPEHEREFWRGTVQEAQKGLADYKNLLGGGGRAAGKAFKDGFIEELNEYLAASNRGFSLTREQYNALSQTARTNLAAAKDSWLDFRNTFARVAAEIEGGNQKVSNALANVVERLKRAAGDYSTTLEATIAPSAEMLPRLVGNSLEKIIDASNKMGRDAQLAITSAAEQIQQALDRINQALDSSVTLQAARIANEVASMMSSVIRTFEEEAARLGLSGQKAWEHVVRKTREVAGPLSAEARKAAEAQLRAYTESITPLPGVWDDILRDIQKATGQWSAETTEQVRGAIGEILGIFDELPGGVGDTLRKVESEFQRWYKLLDNVIRFTDRLLGNKQSGGLIGLVQNLFGIGASSNQGGLPIGTDLGGFIIKNLVGGFSGGAQNELPVIKRTVEDLIKLGANQSLDAAKAAGGTLAGGITSGLSSALAGASGIMAAVTGALALFASTFKSDSRAIRFAGGFAIGGPVGGILSAIFGGPSEIEKQIKRAQQELQLQQARDAITISKQTALQAIQETEKGALEIAHMVADLRDRIATGIDVPDDVWDAFFEDFDRLFAGLVEGMKARAADLTPEMKATAESMQAVAGAAAAIPLALAAVSSSLGASQQQIDLVGESWERLLTRLAQVEEDVSRRTARFARKLAETTAEVPEYVSALTEALTSIAAMPEVSTARIERVGVATEQILTVLSDVFAEMDRFKLRIAGQSAEHALPILELMTGLSDVLNQAIAQPVPTASDWQAVRRNAVAALDTAVSILESLQSENLARLAALSEQATPITSFITAIFGMSQAANESGTIRAIDYAALRQQAREMISVIVQLAQDISAEAAAAGSQLSEAAKDIPGFATSLFGAIRAGSEAAGLRADFSALRQQGRALFDAVQELGRAYSPEALAEMRRIAEAGNEIATFGGNLAGAVTSMSEASQVGAYEISRAVANFSVLVRETATLRIAVGTEMFSAAEEVAQRMAGIAGNLQAFGSSMQAVGQMEIASATPLLQSTRAYLASLTVMLRDVQAAASVSAHIRREADVIEDNLTAAAQAMARGITTAAASLSSSIERPSAAAPVPPPSRPPDTGRGGDQHFHFHDSVIAGRAQIRELVADAIADLKRTNQI